MEETGKAAADNTDNTDERAADSADNADTIGDDADRRSRRASCEAVGGVAGAAALRAASGVPAGGGRVATTTAYRPDPDPFRPCASVACLLRVRAGIGAIGARS